MDLSKASGEVLPRQIGSKSWTVLVTKKPLANHSKVLSLLLTQSHQTAMENHPSCGKL